MTDTFISPMMIFILHRQFPTHTVIFLTGWFGVSQPMKLRDNL